MRQVSRIILHCSASSITGQTAAVLQAWHEERGFRAIGYHAFIRNNGLVEQGREWDEIGAHVYGHNEDSIGICLAGNTVTDFTNAQFTSLKFLLKLLKKIYPLATLHGHNEFTNKGCPVFPMEEWKTFWLALPA